MPNNLREVVLKEGLLKIGGGAFQKCTSLLSIEFPSTLAEIGSDAHNFQFPADTEIDHRVDDGMTGAFSKCSNLSEVVFNDGLRKMGFGHFVIRKCYVAIFCY